MVPAKGARKKANRLVTEARPSFSLELNSWSTRSSHRLASEAAFSKKTVRSDDVFLRDIEARYAAESAVYSHAPSLVEAGRRSDRVNLAPHAAHFHCSCVMMDMSFAAGDTFESALRQIGHFTAKAPFLNDPDTPANFSAKCWARPSTAGMWADIAV